MPAPVESFVHTGAALALAWAGPAIEATTAEAVATAVAAAAMARA
jgi:hypothetical protein